VAAAAWRRNWSLMTREHWAVLSFNQWKIKWAIIFCQKLGPWLSGWPSARFLVFVFDVTVFLFPIFCVFFFLSRRLAPGRPLHGVYPNTSPVPTPNEHNSFCSVSNPCSKAASIPDRALHLHLTPTRIASRAPCPPTSRASA
jgi:hypothetical protein